MQISSESTSFYRRSFYFAFPIALLGTFISAIATTQKGLIPFIILFGVVVPLCCKSLYSNLVHVFLKRGSVKIEGEKFSEEILFEDFIEIHEPAFHMYPSQIVLKDGRVFSFLHKGQVAYEKEDKTILNFFKRKIQQGG